MSDQRAEVEKVLGIGKARRGRRWLVWLVVLAVAAAVGGWYYTRQAQSPSGPSYVTQPVRRGDLVVTVTATGSVEATSVVEISSELSGRLATVLVDFNDRVSAGQVLATLDTQKLEAQVAVQTANLQSAEARVLRAEATLAETLGAYQRARALEKSGLTTAQSLDMLQAAFDRARADLRVANADRALAAANLDLVQAELEAACICSPIDGIVLDRRADPGQVVAASLSAPVLFTIAQDLSQMQLQVFVDEADIGRLAAGNPASFTVETYDDLRFPAEIAKIRYAAEAVDGVVSYMATLTLDNSQGLLRPGMTATAEIVVAEVTDALLVPNAALRFAPPQEAPEEDEEAGGGLLTMIMPQMRRDAAVQGTGRSLWVLRDGKPVEIGIVTGDSDGSWTEILEGDLAEGDTVITDMDG